MSAKEQLIAMAIEFGVQLAQPVLNRLSGDILGSAEATRSTDSIIINRTGYTFRLVSTSLDSGEWNSQNLPLHEILPYQMVHHRSESHGFATGCTGCRCDYQADYLPDGRIWISTSNPYIGGDHAESDGGQHFNILIINGGGNNNVVKFVISQK